MATASLKETYLAAVLLDPKRIDLATKAAGGSN